MFLDGSKKLLKRYEKVADKILAEESVYAGMTDEELLSQSSKLKERIENGQNLDDILVDGYAVIREAAYRAHEMYMFRVQLIGAQVIHEGELAEMRTGEGKTLTIAAPLYLNALMGRGVHVITVNEYLVERDAKFMQEIMEKVGITVGFNVSSMDSNTKREMYARDITYTTNSELGFDYLRDNMVMSAGEKVQRGLHFCVIDEADSVLIDEARTPLIISGGQEVPGQLYDQVDMVVKTLKQDSDYNIDIEQQSITLTPEGVTKVEKSLSLGHLFDIKNSEVVHRLQNALRANYIMQKGKEYIVDDGEIKLVDASTGRVMEGRSYSNGLHQAIQAKEKVKIEAETVTIASITYQSFFRMYSKLSGTSGTAKTDEEEFTKIYNLRVIMIPTNQPVIRDDQKDVLYARKEYKWNAIVEDVKKTTATGQPILIGTASVHASETLHEALTKAGVKHELLNAKNHHREADIIAEAGAAGAVTIATNMAGRGTDIKPDEKAMAAGGLYVIGSEKHESRRVDNQLRGRSGRQGQVGKSKFYISAEDELIARFSGQDRIIKTLDKGEKAAPVQGKLATIITKRAQQRIEGLNFDSRKNLLEYDNVMSQQRQLIYKQRDAFLNRDKPMMDVVRSMYGSITSDLLGMFSNEDKTSVSWTKFMDNVKGRLFVEGELDVKKFSQMEMEEVKVELASQLYKILLKKHEGVSNDLLDSAAREIALKNLDQLWQRHISDLEKLREGISLRSAESQNPLSIYVHDADKMFTNIKQMIAHRTAITLYNAQFRREPTEAELDAARIEFMKQIEMHKEEIEAEAERLNKQSGGHQEDAPDDGGIHSAADAEKELDTVDLKALKKD